MNAINELLQTRQPQTTPPAKTGAGQDGGPSFQDLLHERNGLNPESGRPQDGTEPSAGAAGQTEEPRDDALREMAAALALQPNAAFSLQFRQAAPGEEPLSAQSAPVTEAFAAPAAELPADPALQSRTQAQSDARQETAPAFLTQTQQTAQEAQPRQAAEPQQPLQAAPDTAQAPSRETPQAQTVLTDAVHTAKEASQPAQTRGDEKTAQAQPDAQPQPLFRNVEAAPVKVADPPAVDARSPELDAQLKEAISPALDRGAQSVELKLTPANLGTVTVNLTRGEDGSLQVVLHTTTEKAAALLDQHSAALGALLRADAQAPVQVEVQRQNEAQQNRQQQQQQQFQDQQQGQNAHQQSRQQQRRAQSEDFLHQLRLGLIPLDELAG